MTALIFHPSSGFRSDDKSGASLELRRGSDEILSVLFSCGQFRRQSGAAGVVMGVAGVCVCVGGGGSRGVRGGLSMKVGADCGDHN